MFLSVGLFNETLECLKQIFKRYGASIGGAAKFDRPPARFVDKRLPILRRTPTRLTCVRNLALAQNYPCHMPECESF